MKSHYRKPGVMLLALLGVCSCAGSPYMSDYSAEPEVRPDTTRYDIPLDLPKPDGESGDATKPVKVYVLAGQSNMVGFGRLTGNSPFNGVFLTPDDNVITGVFDVWPSRYDIARLCVRQSADTSSAKGAKVAVYRGSYDPADDYSAMTPIRETTVDLGTVSATLPAVTGPHTPVATAFINVPETGRYRIHAGYKESSHCVVKLDGHEVYRKNPGGRPALKAVELEKGRSYPVEIAYVKGGSAAFWLEQVDLSGRGDLTSVTKNEKEFTWLLDDESKWSVRNDVTFAEARVAANGRWCPLSAMANGRHIGPELGFGYVVGEWHDEQVLLIKTAMGNRSLNFDYRPPSSGLKGDNKYEGLEYRLTVEGVKKVLSKIDKVVPGYRGQGYEIVGLVWWQGHKDRGQTQAQYEGHMVNLIKDLRRDLGAPGMKIAIATVAFEGFRIPDFYMEILKAQEAVADHAKHPDLAGSVATVDARGFWYDRDQSPTGTGYHYNHNAKTYMLAGDALGRAMVGLLGGKAAPRPVPNRPEDHIRPAKSEPTEAERAAHVSALYPIIVDGMLPGFAANPRWEKELRGILRREKRGGQFVRDALDCAVRLYRAAGVTDYDWKPVVPGMMNGMWDYYMFDPKKGEKLPPDMAKWYDPSFDPTKAGWKTGRAPFGQAGGKKVALRSNCSQTYCNCGTTPGTLWEKTNLLMRQTFDLPPVKKGHRYRIVVGGACHVLSGSNYTVWLNGKRLGSGGEVRVRQGGQPRGHHVYPDLMPELESGKVTIAVTSSLRHNARPSPRGHLSVNLEVQKIPAALVELLK